MKENERLLTIYVEDQHGNMSLLLNEEQEIIAYDLDELGTQGSLEEQVAQLVSDIREEREETGHGPDTSTWGERTRFVVSRLKDINAIAQQASQEVEDLFGKHGNMAFHQFRAEPLAGSKFSKFASRRATRIIRAQSTPRQGYTGIPQERTQGKGRTN